MERLTIGEWRKTLSYSQLYIDKLCFIILIEFDVAAVQCKKKITQIHVKSFG